MGLFDKIRKIIRKGEALPHEHGPAVKLAKAADAEAKCPVDHGKIELVKATANDNPACVCGQGSKCYCKAGDAKKTYAKAVVEKQKAAAKTKPSTDSENKKKPVAKKEPAKAPAKKTPAKPAPKATAKKPAPKKK